MKTPHLLVVIAAAAFFSFADAAPHVYAQTRSQTQVKRIKGKVKWFNDLKGFGFITSDSGEDVYFDKAAARGSLPEGECVTFEVKPSPKGPVAKRVRRCPGSKPSTPTGPIPLPTPRTP